MILTNKKTGLQLIFETNESIKMKDLYPEDFELTAETDEERELLKKKEIVDTPLKDKLLGNADTELDKKKKEVEKLGLTVEEEDTLETLQAKIDAEKERLAKYKKDFAAAVKEAKKLKIEVAKEDILETLQAKIKAKKGE